MNNNLLEFIADKIRTLSPRYTASIPDMPRKYCKAGSLLTKGKVATRYKRGLLIERKRNCFCLPLPKSAFVFEPKLYIKVRRKARNDADFSVRLTNMNLNSDDIESVINELTYGKIKLHLRGRTIFDDVLD